MLGVHRDINAKHVLNLMVVGQIKIKLDWSSCMVSFGLLVQLVCVKESPAHVSANRQIREVPVHMKGDLVSHLNKWNIDAISQFKFNIGDLGNKLECF